MPDARPHDALRLVAGGLNEALHRLEVWLAAQLEGLMMHWKQKFRTAIGAHAPSLLGIAMYANPGIVSPDRHDRQIHGPGAPHGTKRVR